MDDQHQQLLQQLKTTVEGLLISQVSNVWHVYGGLNRLHNIMCKIFRHGCKTLSQQGEPDVWIFIQGLSWLQPTLAASPTFVLDTAKGVKDKAANWLYKSLESHSLSQKLSWLLSDKEHLASCYEPSAFLCQPRYSEATLICLRAVEENQLSLLTDIDPSLFLSKWKAHRRCSSFPDAMQRAAKLKHKLVPPDTELAAITPPTPAPISATVESTLSTSEVKEKRDSPVLRAWRSLPSLLEAIGKKTEERERQPKSAPVSRRPCTLPSSPAIHRVQPSPKPPEQKTLSPSVLKIDYKQLQKESTVKKGILKKSKSNTNELIVMKDVSRSEPIKIKLSKHNEVNISLSSNGSSDILERRRSHKSIHEITNSIYEETDSSYVDSSSQNSFSHRVRLKGGVRCGIKNSRRKSFMESGGNSVQPMSTGYFPRPTQGQSLASFLSSGQFAGAKAELDRENAHFAISEAMIAAIEQVKFNMWAKVAEDTIEESDEEINNLKQRIRLRRRQKQEERRRNVLGLSLLSDGKTDTTTTESVSPLSTSPGGSSDSISTDGVDDLEIDDNTSNLNKLNQSGLSVSLASLFSEAELSRPPQRDSDVMSGTGVTAEGVALALLRRFSDKQLPRASDIEWLVSEQDACGQRLLPLPTSVPVSPDEAEDQDMRKATPLRGTVEWAPPRPQIIFTAHPPPERRILMAKQNYRCAGCGLTVAQQYAGRFRYCEYLGRYFCTGCHTNQLAVIPGRVIQKWDFTREDGCLQDFLRSTPPYFLMDPHVYSIQDLKQVKIGEMTEQLKLHVTAALAHVEDCVLCQGRGFVCEVCNKPEVIFPWQLMKVDRCNSCGNCFHSDCYKVGTTACGRCFRLTKRKNSILTSPVEVS
ncbi:run domain Beclin-1-interacting and cysteine-rich domain-containing protein-like isoform X2 [Macrosteles quadrilineatus]|uniref:run domain Beclin-1-interacting and cysteine-rich domain-containing protein-like isoform X2 n=1 Tax=Macrosteles quadrilineatus TaxID=74068 RepID=UPI0023E0A2D2|nr:run domain Beclin-1-interacting and cysteine-rich domain-containing protein-like isoform X2 [Macrosteles quadrilineatus]